MTDYDELVRKLDAFSHDKACIHCGSPALEINYREQVICCRCLGENPRDPALAVYSEAAQAIKDLRAENVRLRKSLGLKPGAKLVSREWLDKPRAALSPSEDG
ncbi:hypothetical protein [Ruegeria jejuensis]|uniref:hypothetical protein n=1 Tax=Ruegeria jejuensis TaxID=3233338 RepID=UPI00355B4CFC